MQEILRRSLMEMEILHRQAELEQVSFCLCGIALNDSTHCFILLEQTVPYISYFLSFLLTLNPG